MAPAAKLNLISASNLLSSVATSSQFRVQGWDPVLILSQIVALQAAHYVALAFAVPVCLTLFGAGSDAVSSEGGVASVEMIMDWKSFVGGARHAAAAAFVHLRTGEPVRASDDPAATLAAGLLRAAQPERLRAWATVFAWVAASMADLFALYHLIRRPTHILDHSLTLVAIHIILTTYYSGSFPLSFFYWTVLTLTAVTQIVVAEQLCVRREMREGFKVPLPAQTVTRPGRTLSGSGAALLGIARPPPHGKSMSTSSVYAQSPDMELSDFK